MCCPDGKFEFDSKYGRVCAERPAGAACDGNKYLCASRVCGLDGLCKDEVPGTCVGVPAGCGESYEPLFGTNFNGTCDSLQTTMHCENRSGCQCDVENENGNNACIGAPLACEEHLDASSCTLTRGCTWLAYYPGICVDAACGPLYSPYRCSSFHDSTFNLKDSCETNLEKCNPICAGQREGCICSTYDYDCELTFKNGLTQHVCEGTTVCDHVEKKCRTAQSRSECLALREEGAGCNWMVLWRDWDENSVTGKELSEEEMLSSTSANPPVSEEKKDREDQGIASNAFPPGPNPASDTAHSLSSGSPLCTLERASLFLVVLNFLLPVFDQF